MTERVSEFGTSAVIPLEEADNSDKSAGTMLREAREAHGLHIEMVAAALKVPAQKLLALEADDIAALPDPVFARALASSVCRALRVDPAPVLAKLPGAPKAAVAMADRNLKTHIVSGTSRWGSGRSAGLPSRALLTVVALLLVGAAAIFWLPQSVFDRIGSTVSRITARGAAEIGPNAGEPPAATGTTPGVATENVPVPAAAVGTARPRPWRLPRRRSRQRPRPRRRRRPHPPPPRAARRWSSWRARNAGSPSPTRRASSCCGAACWPAKRSGCRGRCRSRWWSGAHRASMCRCSASPSISNPSRATAALRASR